MPGNFLQNLSSVSKEGAFKAIIKGYMFACIVDLGKTWDRHKYVDLEQQVCALREP